MLACEFHRFEHQASGKRLIRSATAYSVPAELAQHIDFVGGVTHFPKVRKPLVNSAVKNAKGPGGETLLDLQVTPWLLRGLYSVGDVQGKSSKNSQCVAQFLEEYYTQGKAPLTSTFDTCHWDWHFITLQLIWTNSFCSSIARHWATVPRWLVPITSLLALRPVSTSNTSWVLVRIVLLHLISSTTNMTL